MAPVAPAAPLVSLWEYVCPGTRVSQLAGIPSPD